MTKTDAPVVPDGVVQTMLPVRGGEIQVLEGGSGPPILFLHAAGGAGTWLPFHDRMAETHRVLAPDHPGFGGSDELDWAEGVDDLAFHYLDVMDALRLELPTVVGTSFGGWVAAELAVLAGSRIDKLVLIDPIGLRIPGVPIADLFAMNPQETVAALFHDPSVAAGFFPAEPDLDFVIKVVSDQTAFARFAWEPFCCNPKLERRLHRITAPTLVLWGEFDRLLPRVHGDRYAELIPDAWLEIVPDAGHAVHMEQPERAVAAISAFVDKS